MGQTQKDDGFILTGKHVIFIIIGFFSVVFGVNAYMVTQSIKTYRGEDTKQSYRQGLAYNDTLQKRKAQRATGWSADIKISNTQAITLTISDDNATQVRGLTVTGILKHPAETDLDLPLTFTQNPDGSYTAALKNAPAGKWYLTTKAQRSDGLVFDTRNEITL